MTEEQFYQKFKSSIKEKKLDIDSVSFQPVMKIVMELPLGPVTDAGAFVSKQKLYELIGRAICGDSDLMDGEIVRTENV